MHHRVLNGLLVVSSCFLTTRAIDIDGKLDFGNARSSYPSFRSQNVEYKTKFVPVKFTKTINTEEPGEDFEKIGVVCVSGGCNTTKSVSTKGDTIQTDVVVHVQTKVDLNQNKTNVIDDTPDIPIVVGYKGAKLDTTIDDEARSLTPQSVIYTDLDTNPHISSFKPNYHSTSSLNTYFSPIGSSRTPSISSRVDSSSPFNRQNQPLPSRSFYATDSNPDLNINIKPLPSIGVSMTGSTKTGEQDIKYKPNGIEINIPYFEPSYHSHYYGEHPPPQYVYYMKKTNSLNPVEFKTVKATWSPSFWERKITPHTHTTTVGGSGVQCTCKEGQSPTGLRWYPSSSRKIPNGDPGSQINDKLAPLNK